VAKLGYVGLGTMGGRVALRLLMAGHQVRGYDLVPAAVYACDADGIIREFNHRAAELWGRSPNTTGNGDSRNGFVEKFCGSHRIYYPDGRFMPHEKCPMARILRGEEREVDELEIVVETLAEGFMLLIVMGERAVELADTQDATTHDEGDARVQGLRERVARFQRTLSF